MRMKKDFPRWHKKKAQIDEIEKRAFFHEREIWFCYLGANVGFEQDGSGKDFLRPVVIIRKFNQQVFWGIPLTHTKKKKPYYFAFKFIKSETSVAVLSQLHLIDARRLSYKIGEMSLEDFSSIKAKIKALLP